MSIVCTRYIPEDSPALTLGGSKSVFRVRAHLLKFGKRAYGIVERRHDWPFC